MTIGEKIKKARLENGFTQEELAEKLMVSRQAITKWEADRGIPDVPNLKLLARLLGVSVDYLIDDGEAVDMTVIRETINLSKYGKAIFKKSLTDKLMRDKFPDAEIRTLIPKKKMDKAEKAVETFLLLTTPFPNMIEFLNSLKLLGTEYYLVTRGKRQFFVAVHYKESLMESRRTSTFHNAQTNGKFTIGDLVFTICAALKG